MTDFDLPPPPPDEDVSEEEALTTLQTDGITANAIRNKMHADPVVSSKASQEPTQPPEI
jgi:hypothetical protein|tara:strand:- start:382 stop:558 length:177 start_codon:yes stop_codon:yes gene_type:complete